jgi:hypothetical protein
MKIQVNQRTNLDHWLLLKDEQESILRQMMVESIEQWSKNNLKHQGEQIH